MKQRKHKATTRRIRLGITPIKSRKLHRPKPTLEKQLAQTLNNKKAESIVILSLKGKSSMADSMIIATGTSSTHLAALARHAINTTLLEGHQVLHTEGLPNSNWVIVDTGDIVIHLFTKEARNLYQLEKMWSISLEDLSNNNDDAAA